MSGASSGPRRHRLAEPAVMSRVMQALRTPSGGGTFEQTGVEIYAVGLTSDLPGAGPFLIVTVAVVVESGIWRLLSGTRPVAPCRELQPWHARRHRSITETTVICMSVSGLSTLHVRRLTWRVTLQICTMASLAVVVDEIVPSNLRSHRRPGSRPYDTRSDVGCDHLPSPESQSSWTAGRDANSPRPHAGKNIEHWAVQTASPSMNLPNCRCASCTTIRLLKGFSGSVRMPYDGRRRRRP